MFATCGCQMGTRQFPSSNEYSQRILVSCADDDTLRQYLLGALDEPRE
jgi:hypothetical protein